VGNSNLCIASIEKRITCAQYGKSKIDSKLSNVHIMMKENKYGKNFKLSKREISNYLILGLSA
jgi:hypothetical protein